VATGRRCGGCPPAASAEPRCRSASSTGPGYLRGFAISVLAYGLATGIAWVVLRLTGCAPAARRRRRVRANPNMLPSGYADDQTALDCADRRRGCVADAVERERRARLAGGLPAIVGRRSCSLSPPCGGVRHGRR
jgi:hypothetical protein